MAGTNPEKVYTTHKLCLAFMNQEKEFQHTQFDT